MSEMMFFHELAIGCGLGNFVGLGGVTDISILAASSLEHADGWRTRDGEDCGMWKESGSSSPHSHNATYLLRQNDYGLDDR